MISKIPIALMAFVVMLTSCSEETIQEETISKSSINFQDITAINIPNGLPNSCEYNLLIFPNFETFRAKSESLDTENENQNDWFDTTVDPDFTDDEVEAFYEAQAFDEDGIFIGFEEQYSFCSLRRHIAILEDDWIASQGDGDWDINDDPDNHFIDEESIRTLLNSGTEVAIGNIESFVIYKFTSFHSWIEIHNQDYNALQQINLTGVVPANNPNVIEVVTNSDPSFSCKDDGDFRRFVNYPGKTRIKTVNKYNTQSFLSNGKVKTKTKYYRKKFGIWRRGKTTIGVSLVSDVPLLCAATGQPPAGVSKSAKRSKVKIRWEINYNVQFPNVEPQIQEGATFAIHSRRNDLVKIDLFNGDIQ